MEKRKLIKDYQKLIRVLKEGEPEEKDKTAQFICKTKSTEIAGRLFPLLKDDDPAVRGITVIILSVIGFEKAKNLLQHMKESDKAANVRVAADIGLRFFGKITYKNMHSEIKRYFSRERNDHDSRMEEIKPEGKAEIPEKIGKIEKAKHPEKEEREGDVELKKEISAKEQIERLKAAGSPVLEQRGPDRKEEKKDVSEESAGFNRILHKKRALILPLALIILIAVPLISIKLFFKNGDKAAEESKQQKTVGIMEILENRDTDIQDFTTQQFSPDQFIDQLPYTIAVSTFYDDNYGLLLNRIYSNAGKNEHGKNTVLAFWRKFNFPDIKTQVDKELLFKDAGKGKLIFPNYAAMHLRYDLTEGSLAFEDILKPNKDVEISITVTKVELK